MTTELDTSMDSAQTWKCGPLFKQAGRYLEFINNNAKCIETCIFHGSKCIWFCSYSESEDEINFCTFFKEGHPSNYSQEINHTYSKERWSQILSHQEQLHWSNTNNYFGCKLNTTLPQDITEPVISMELWDPKTFLSDILCFMNDTKGDEFITRFIIKMDDTITYDLEMKNREVSPTIYNHSASIIRGSVHDCHS